jgi:hypothetical protein
MSRSVLCGIATQPSVISLFTTQLSRKTHQIKSLQQCRADGGIVAVADAVADVPPYRFRDCRDDRVLAAQAGDRNAQHDHQLTALLLQVTEKQQPQRWIARKQPP